VAASSRQFQFVFTIARRGVRFGGSVRVVDMANVVSAPVSHFFASLVRKLTVGCWAPPHSSLQTRKTARGRNSQSAAGVRDLSSLQTENHCMLKLLITTIALATASGANAQSATYSVEAGHTFVTFEVVHAATSTTRGRFDDVQGTITLDPTAKTGHAEIVIDPASISSGVKPFDEHLRNEDFLNVTAYPKATFVGDGFTFEGDKVTALSGVLTLLGKARPVTLLATRFNCYDNPRTKRQVCGGDFATTLQRSAYGMSFGLPGIPDEVRIVIQIEAVKQ